MTDVRILKKPTIHPFWNTCENIIIMTKKKTPSYNQYVNMRNRWAEFMHAMDAAGPKAMKQFDIWANDPKNKLISPKQIFSDNEPKEEEKKK
jgi:hypothetical protein